GAAGATSRLAQTDEGGVAAVRSGLGPGSGRAGGDHGGARRPDRGARCRAEKPDRGEDLRGPEARREQSGPAAVAGGTGRPGGPVRRGHRPEPEGPPGATGEPAGAEQPRLSAVPEAGQAPGGAEAGGPGGGGGGSGGRGAGHTRSD